MFLAVVALLCGGGSRAHAKANGFAVDSCGGCHNGGKMPTVTITADPMSPDPGGSTTLTIAVSRVNGNTAGFYLTSNKVGAFTAVAGEGTRLATPTEVVHSAPKASATGDVTFRVRWTAPAVKGGVDFDVWAVSANGNNRSSGDGEGMGSFSITYGCPGVVAYPDRDGDGYGSEGEMTRVCELGAGFVMQGGDCNDNVKDIHPGAPEVCNFYDDNCDGQVNEGLPMVRLYRDADGDGHGSRTTMDMRTFCGPLTGYATSNDDCDDNDPKTYPGAPELCDFKDNDCNGRVDDGARAYCGEGWCRRQAPTCDAKSCVPGMPDTRGEVCDGLDNDCNGLVDDGPNVCPKGMSCFQAQCIPSGQAAQMAAAMAPQTVPDGSAVGDGGVIIPPADEARPSRRRTTAGCAVGTDGRGGTAGVLVGLILVCASRRRRRHR